MSTGGVYLGGGRGSEILGLALVVVGGDDMVSGRGWRWVEMGGDGVGVEVEVKMGFGWRFRAWG